MSERVVFLRPDAERIARVVRKVEGFRSEPPLTFRRVMERPNREVFRVCTFAGAWGIGAVKTVTFKNQTSTPNTAAAINLFFPIDETAAAGDCAIAKEGTSWYLIDVPFQTATIAVMQSTTTGFYVKATASSVIVQSTAPISFLSESSTSSSNVVTDVSISASLNTNDCIITVSKTLTTQSITVANASGTQTALIVSATATGVSISSSATAIFATQTATATVLRLKVT